MGEGGGRLLDVSSEDDACARERFLLVTVGTAGRTSTLRVPGG